MPPGNRYLVTALDTGDAIVWNATTGDKVHTLKGHAYPLTNCFITGGNRFVITTDSKGNAKMWSLQTGELQESFEGQEGAIVTSVAMTHNPVTQHFDSTTVPPSSSTGKWN